MAIDLKKLHEKFFTDPDWREMEELIESYIAPFRSVSGVVTKGMSNDEIATEVRGRQLMVEQLDKFLEDTKIVRSRINREPISYK